MRLQLHINCDRRVDGIVYLHCIVCKQNSSSCYNDRSNRIESNQVDIALYCIFAFFWVLTCIYPAFRTTLLTAELEISVRNIIIIILMYDLIIMTQE
jgi:hypothetical protein